MNVDHVATIRNARGGAHPDPFAAALVCVGAGADGITVHLREDRRHIRDDDLERIAASPEIRLNFEMAATDEMVAIALRLRPAACCLVPEKRTEVTTEGGLDAAGQRTSLRPKVAALRDAGIRVCLFLDPTRRSSRPRRRWARRWWSCTPAPMPRASPASWSGCAAAAAHAGGWGWSAMPGTA